MSFKPEILLSLGGYCCDLTGKPRPGDKDPPPVGLTLIPLLLVGNTTGCLAQFR